MRERGQLDWSDYNAKRMANIKSQVHIADVLSHYGIRMMTKDREFQYPCPLHGDGQDNSYSARMYPESNSTYCFACHKSRDVVGWVMDAEALGFGRALSFLERTFGVRNVPKPEMEGLDDSARREVAALLDKQRAAPTFLDVLGRVEAKLVRALRASASLPMDRVLKAFFLLDNLRYDAQHGTLDEEKGRDVVNKVFLAAAAWEQGEGAPERPSPRDAGDSGETFEED